ncbi:uncharacterized protein LOC62_03G003629 [Vanrija pseudolonga]|uniref:Uncharacterized protein n=1 Tax=Vanrija pseudolonga TaxID=143232 RepID=A0AAF0Y693_9TREE|nr:hypothetical protein LOC62_03G003629 [Vanrija pseudolonga]
MKPHILALAFLASSLAVPPPPTDAVAHVSPTDSELASSSVLTDAALSKCKRALFPRDAADDTDGEPAVCAYPSEFNFTWDRGCAWCRTCVWWCAKFEAGYAYTEKGQPTPPMKLAILAPLLLAVSALGAPATTPNDMTERDATHELTDRACLWPSKCAINWSVRFPINLGGCEKYCARYGRRFQLMSSAGCPWLQKRCCCK